MFIWFYEALPTALIAPLSATIIYGPRQSYFFLFFFYVLLCFIMTSLVSFFPPFPPPTYDMPSFLPFLPLSCFHPPNRSIQSSMTPDTLLLHFFNPSFLNKSLHSSFLPTFLSSGCQSSGLPASLSLIWESAELWDVKGWLDKDEKTKRFHVCSFPAVKDALHVMGPKMSVVLWGKAQTWEGIRGSHLWGTLTSPGLMAELIGEKTVGGSNE